MIDYYVEILHLSGSEYAKKDRLAFGPKICIYYRVRTQQNDAYVVEDCKNAGDDNTSGSGETQAATVGPLRARTVLPATTHNLNALE